MPPALSGPLRTALPERACGLGTLPEPSMRGRCDGSVNLLLRRQCRNDPIQKMQFLPRRIFLLVKRPYLFVCRRHESIFAFKRNVFVAQPLRQILFQLLLAQNIGVKLLQQVQLPKPPFPCFGEPLTRPHQRRAVAWRVAEGLFGVIDFREALLCAPLPPLDPRAIVGIAQPLIVLRNLLRGFLQAFLNPDALPEMLLPPAPVICHVDRAAGLSWKQTTAYLGDTSGTIARGIVQNHGSPLITRVSVELRSKFKRELDELSGVPLILKPVGDGPIYSLMNPALQFFV